MLWIEKTVGKIPWKTSCDKAVVFSKGDCDKRGANIESIFSYQAGWSL